MRKYIETHPSISLGLGTSKYARRRQKSDIKATEIAAEEQVIELLQSGERKKKKEKINDGEQHVQTSNVATLSDVPTPGERYDSHPAPEKSGDMWILDCVIMNQTTEGREQEAVALVIMNAHSSLVRVIPFKNRGNVLPHTESPLSKSRPTNIASKQR